MNTPETLEDFARAVDAANREVRAEDEPIVAVTFRGVMVEMSVDAIRWGKWWEGRPGIRSAFDGDGIPDPGPGPTHLEPGPMRLDITLTLRASTEIPLNRTADPA